MSKRHGVNVTSGDEDANLVMSEDRDRTQRYVRMKHMTVAPSCNRQLIECKSVRFKSALITTVDGRKSVN